MTRLYCTKGSRKINREELRLKEIYRYLGMEKSSVDEVIKQEIEFNIERLLKIAVFSYYVEIYPIEFYGAGKMKIGPLKIKSLVLEKNLQDSSAVCLLGATLGIAVDQLIHRLEFSSHSDQLITDAICAEVIETGTNWLCKELDKIAREHHLKAFPRFSPGFGDYNLENQRPLIEALNLPKEIGISLTQENMMVPTKSVTALMGLKPDRKRE